MEDQQVEGDDTRWIRTRTIFNCLRLHNPGFDMLAFSPLCTNIQQVSDRLLQSIPLMLSVPNSHPLPPIFMIDYMPSSCPPEAGLSKQLFIF